MPSKPNIPCKHPGCPALIPYGTRYCDAHKKLHPEETRSASARGYGAAWQRESRRFLAMPEHRLCEECLKEGRYVKATVVDHVVPHREIRRSSGIEATGAVFARVVTTKRPDVRTAIPRTITEKAQEGSPGGRVSISKRRGPTDRRPLFREKPQDGGNHPE